MSKVRTLSLWCITLLCIAGVTLAQGDSCPILVQQALDSVDLNCAGTNRNEACYGHAMLNAEVVGDVVFESVGDIGAVNQIQRLALSGLDLNTDQWGIALFQLQANIPNTLPGQNVTFIAYGDTSIENDTLGEEEDLSSLLPPGLVDRVQVPVTSNTQSLNVRSGPATTFDIVARISSSDTAQAVGRSADGTWLQVLLSNGNDGWVASEFVTPDGDLETLPPATVDSNIARDEVLALGESAVGTISEADDEIVYTFVAEVGDTIGIEMNTLSGNLDPVLRLFNADGTLLAENDDFAGRNAAINAFVVPQTGPYTIVASRLLSGATTGEFELNLGLNPGLNFEAPLQAFYFTTGIGSSECNEVPDDGILIRTPSGAGEVRFLINEVLVELGSTVIARATDGELFLGVLEGRMRVEAFGEAQFASAGFSVSVPLAGDERPSAAGPPSTPQSLADEATRGLDLLEGLFPVDDAEDDETVEAEASVPVDAAQLGNLLVTLEWDNNADMDLFVTEPTGTTISYLNTSSPTGAALNSDINEDCETDSAPYVETVSWPTGQARLGAYEVAISEYRPCGAGAANWTLTVEADGVVILEESGSGEATFSFNR